MNHEGAPYRARYLWAGLIGFFLPPRAYTWAKRRTIGRLFVGPPGTHFGGKQRQKRYVYSAFGDFVN